MQEEEFENLSLVNIEGGAAVEMFDIALQQILENIYDINTDDSFREIKLIVKMKPMSGEDRSIIGYSIKCDKKMSGQPMMMGTAEMKIENGRLVAIDRKQKQRKLNFDVVVPMQQSEQE